jgi:hypothetical protein
VIIHYIVGFYARSSFHAIHFVMFDHMLSPIDEVILYLKMLFHFMLEEISSFSPKWHATKYKVHLTENIYNL